MKYPDILMKYPDILMRYPDILMKYLAIFMKYLDIFISQTCQSINHLTALWSKGITSCFFEQLHTPRRQPDQDQDQNLMLVLNDDSPMP